MSHELAASYLNTELVFDLPNHGAWVLRPERVGAVTPAHSPCSPTSELISHLGLENPAFVVTAANPNGQLIDPHLNKLRNTRLFWRLRDLGLEAIPCIGRSLNQDHQEESFWVPTRGIPGADFVIAGEAIRFQQNAIFRAVPGSIELLGIAMPILSGSSPTSWWCQKA